MSFRVIYTIYKATLFAREFLEKLLSEDLDETKKNLEKCGFDFEKYVKGNPHYKKLKEFISLIDVMVRSRRGKEYEELFDTYKLMRKSFDSMDFKDTDYKLAGIELVCCHFLDNPNQKWEESDDL